MNKRRKKKKRYKIKNILMLVIIIFLIVKLFSVLINSGKDNKDEIVKKSEPKTYLNKVNKTDNYNEDIDKDIQNTIVKYMDSYFKSITTLKEVDMTNLFCDDSYEEAYINQTAISLLINSRKLERNKMTISNAKYDIIFDNINKKNDTVTVNVLENDYFYFDFMKDIESKVYEVENTFVLKKTNRFLCNDNK